MLQECPAATCGVEWAAATVVHDDDDDDDDPPTPGTVITGRGTIGTIIYMLYKTT